MNPTVIGTGFAPAVTIVGVRVYAAYGTVPHALVLVTLGLDGTELAREKLPGGFDQSYPRFDGHWLTYRQDEAHGYVAVAFNVLTRQFWSFAPAGGTYCLAVNATLDLVAFEWQRFGEPWRIWLGSLGTGAVTETVMRGAPDGLAAILAPDRVTLRKDTRNDVAGMFYPVRSGDIVVGERPDRWLNAPPEGAAVLLDGEAMRIAFADQNAPTPGCATDGTTYAIVTGGAPSVRVWLGSRGDVLALPPPSNESAPTVFAFNHDVMVCVFKDPAGTSGAAAEIIVNRQAVSDDQVVARPYFVAEDSTIGSFRGVSLGGYSEARDPSALPFERLLLCHDSQEPWRLPSGLRPWDIPMFELYWYKGRGETLLEAVARWRRDRDAMLTAWLGDCAVCPQFYCMGGPKGGTPPNHELLTVSEVKQTHPYLNEMVNASPRIKIVAPFAYERANGITAHPELRAAFNALLAAAPGLVELTPIGTGPKPKPKPKPKPDPKPPAGPFKPATRFEVHMEPKRYAFRLGEFFASITPGDVYPKDHAFEGWHRVHFKRENDRTNPQCEFVVTQPKTGDPKLMLRHPLTGTVMSADATEFSGDLEGEFAAKPGVTDETWGGYEAWDGWDHDGIPTVRVTYFRKGEKYESAGLTAVAL